MKDLIMDFNQAILFSSFKLIEIKVFERTHHLNCISNYTMIGKLSYVEKGGCSF